MVVVQLAMGQFSPRIVQRILQDKPSQLAIGLFVATFVHAVLAAREVTNNGRRHRASARESRSSPPSRSCSSSIAVLVMYVHHIGQALRVSALIELVGKDTRELLDRVYVDKGPPLETEPAAQPVVSGQAIRGRHREWGATNSSRKRGGDGLPARAGSRESASSSPQERAALPRPRRAGRPRRGTAAPSADPEAGADARRGRRVRHPTPRRHRRAFDRLLAAPRPDHRRPGASTGSTTSCRQLARRPVPGRPSPRRSEGDGQADRAGR